MEHLSISNVPQVCLHGGAGIVLLMSIKITLHKMCCFVFKRSLFGMSLQFQSIVTRCHFYSFLLSSKEKRKAGERVAVYRDNT